MGVKIFELVPKTELELTALSGKRLAIDTSLFLYQFLATIRQPDGSPLTDSKGRVTSHLIGLFSRTTKLLQMGIKPCFVLDGKPPVLKKAEQARRAELKTEAEAKYHVAVEKDDVEGMRKYAARSIRLTKDMIAEAVKLIEALGLPVVQGTGEGEAQAAYLARQGDVWAAASQDADSLVFGAPRLVRNLAITGRKKKPGQLAYINVRPELIELKNVLGALKLDQDQLIALAMLVGTDYDIGGIKGIGPKKAFKLVTEHAHDFKTLFDAVQWSASFDVGWQEVFDLFKHPAVNKEYTLKWSMPNAKAVTSLLVDEHDFSAERVEKSLNDMFKTAEHKQQQGLASFF
ncbi:flap endonuclease-1 [Candidatus Woesearchaeota archaeon]|nr:flap endonuclease-1 [Candidatus Woesearchaeota archaeon]